MKIPSTAKAFIWGATAGFVHASSESIVLGASGIPLSLAGGVELAVTYALAAGATFACLWAVLPGRVAARDDSLNRLAAWALPAGLAAVYWWCLPAGEYTYALAGLAASVAAAALALRSKHDPLAVVVGFICVSSVLCALMEVSVRLEAVTAGDRWIFILFLAAPAAVAFALTTFLSLSRSESPSPNGHSGVVAVVVYAVLTATLWLTVLPTKRTWTFSEVRKVIADDAGSKRPSVLLVVFDTLRADHMDLFGYERKTMPQLTRWAREEAFLIRQTQASSPWTVPSHASMFTGSYPYAHGAHLPFLDDDSPPEIAYPLRSDVPTLAEFLRDQGYSTAAVASNRLSLEFGLDRGFEFIHRPTSPAERIQSSTWLHRFRVPGKNITGAEALRRMVPSFLRDDLLILDSSTPINPRADAIRSGAIEWLNRKPDGPFFLFLNFMEAHEPYVPLPKHRGLFAPPSSRLRWGNPYSYPYALLKSVMTTDQEFTDGEIEHLEGAYDESLLGLDEQFALLIADLQRLGLYDELAIIVTSDHGESFFEHGFMRHERSLYEPQIAIPFIVKTPKNLDAEELLIGDHIQFVDIFPTVVSLIDDVQAPSHIQGSPWGSDRDFAFSELYCGSCRTKSIFPEGPIELFRRELAAVTRGSRKRIWTGKLEHLEVYDLETDPDEQNNIAEDVVLRVHPGQEPLATLDRETNTYRSEKGGNLAPEFLEKLKSLGYIQ